MTMRAHDMIKDILDELTDNCSSSVVSIYSH
jgi:hypothetical protein